MRTPNSKTKVMTGRLFSLVTLVFVAPLHIEAATNAVDLAWTAKAVGGRASAIAVALDPQGNILVTGAFGETAHFGAIGLTNRYGNGGMFVAKYSANGQVLWAKNAEPTPAGSSVVGWGVVSDRQGNCHVTGKFQGPTFFGSVILTNRTNGSVFVEKFGPDGDFKWVRQTEDYEADAWGIAADASGNVYVAGGFRGDVIYKNITLSGQEVRLSSNGGALVAKFAPDGSLNWKRNWRAYGLGGAVGAAVDSSNNVYVTGSFIGLLDFDGVSLTSTSLDDRRMFIAMLNAEGNVVWTIVPMNPSGQFDARGISAGGNGNFYVTGAFDGANAQLGSGETGFKANGPGRFLAKFDSTGKLAWAINAGPRAVNEGRGSITMDPVGNVLVVGSTWIRKFNSSGELILSGLFTAANDPSPAVAAKNNAIYVAGGRSFGDILTKLVEVPPAAITLDGFVTSEGAVTKYDSTVVAIKTTYPNGSLFYTLDGSAPSFSSSPYTEPFKLKASATIRVIAYSADFKQSSQAGPVEVRIAPTYTLTAGSAGGGRVEINPVAQRYPQGSVVTVTAIPNSGWSFLHWQGDGVGTNTVLQLPLNQNLTVQPVFGTGLRTASTGSGQILRKPELPIYPYGSTVRLTAIPDNGNYFGVWGDAGRGRINPLDFSVTKENLGISALFAPLSVNQVTLAVIENGFGAVAVSPATNVYTKGQTVTLTAVPEPKQAFTGWGGDASGSNNSLLVTMNSSLVITANFTKRPTLSAQAPLAGMTPDGFRLLLTGEFDVAYRILASTNFADWLPLGVVTNQFGTVQFIDGTATNPPLRFYRAESQ